MHIRPIEAHELEALLALYAHLHEADDPRPAPEVVQRVGQELLGSARERCLGGFLGPQLIASCVLSVVPNLTRGCRPYGLIENVVTHAEHRRQGHGQALLRHALDEAWSRGCYKVMLLTGRKDPGTLRFYESVGFDPQGKQAFIAKPAAT